MNRARVAVASGLTFVVAVVVAGVIHGSSVGDDSPSVPPDQQAIDVVSSHWGDCIQTIGDSPADLQAYGDGAVRMVTVESPVYLLWRVTYAKGYSVPADDQTNEALTHAGC